MERLRAAIVTACAGERGLALPLALIALVVLAALAGALLVVGSMEVTVAGNHLRATQAYFLAEAGLEDAFNAFRDFPTNVAAAPSTLTTVPGLSGASPTLAAFGSYGVQYQGLGGNTVRVVATGCAGSASCPSSTALARKVLTAVFTNNFTVDTAIVTGTGFAVSGQARVSGTCGSVHANGNLSVTGSPTIARDLTASGSYTASGSPTVGGQAGGGYPSKAVPTIDPASFLATAKASLPADQVFQLMSDGRVLDGYDSVLATVAPGASHRGWNYTPGAPATWTYAQTTPYDGTYYVDGNARITGEVGGGGAPWRTTVIATQNIQISGEPGIDPHLPGTLFIAGLDIDIAGEGGLARTTTLAGLIGAHGAVNLRNEVRINGAVIAEGANGSSGIVASPGIGGEVVITYDCGAVSPPLGGSLRALSWGP